MIGWVTYCVLIASFLGVAALVAERALAAVNVPGRWAWAAALAGSTGLPAWVWLAPSPSTPGSFAPLPGAYVMDLVPAAMASGAESGVSPLWAAPGWTTLALVGWAAASASLLLYLFVSVWRLRSAGRGWRREAVGGVDVLVSRSTGPAAVGVVRGRVVVPEWVLGLDARRRRLLVLHEAEHVRARDPQLALAGLILCALVPWNVVMWWQLARLRVAIELDCDARVLRRSDDVRGYGSLLLEVGQRRARLAVGLAESKSSLERRIRMITRVETRRRLVRALGLGCVTAVVLAVACETPGPTELARPAPSDLELAGLLGRPASAGDCVPLFYVDGERQTSPTDEELKALDVERIELVRLPPDVERPTRPPGYCGTALILTKGASPEAEQRHDRLARVLAWRLGREERPASMEELAEGPTFTPFTVRPQLRNAPEVQRSLMRHYPPLLRRAGIGGTANVWFLLDDAGAVAQVRINTSSGHEALDEAALRVARTMQFAPAYNDEQPVPAWVALDIRFETAAGGDATEEPATPEARGAPAGGDAPLAQEPTFTPMTERPHLVNAEAVRTAIGDRYPPLLRDAGVEAAANVWLFIDETGTVRQTRINRTSGYGALDEAALEVARAMRFTPAKNRDQPVPVWVALDIRFERR